MTGSAAGARRVRLLPVLIVALGALGFLKAASLLLVGGYSFLPITAATAQDPAGAPKEAAEASAQGAAAGPREEGLGAQGGTPAAGDPTLDEGRRINLSAPQETLSESERMVLESLRARRQEIDQREKALEMQKQLLEAAEQRLAEKIADLKAIEAQVEESFQATDDVEEERLASLVKMYETMKPKKAARIFDRLDLDVLIGVARRMSPSILADIIAAMDPAVAERVTVELARLSRLQPATSVDDLAPVGPQ